MDEAQSACVVDALVVVCKRLTENLRLIDSDEVKEIQQLLENAEATRQELEEISNGSDLWSGIIAFLAKMPVFSGIDDVVVFSTKLPSHMQRAVAALLGCAELSVQLFPSSCHDVAESLYRSLFGHSSSDKLLVLIEEYRQLFPFFYLFARRMGQVPENSLPVWKKFFHTDDYIVPTIATPGLVPIQPTSIRDERPIVSDMQENDDDESDHDFKSHTNGAEMFPLQSTWAVEEDEDSDGQDFVSPPLVAESASRRTTTRMKSAKHRSPKKRSGIWSVKRRTLSTNGVRDNAIAKPSLFTSSGGIIDEDVHAYSTQAGDHDGSISDVVDFNDNSSVDSENDRRSSDLLTLEHTMTSTGGGSHDNNSNITEDSASEDDTDGLTSSAEMVPHSHDSTLAELPSHISLADLRYAFDHSQVPGRFEADKNRLCRELYSSGVITLADKVRELAGVTLSWQQLKDLALKMPSRGAIMTSPVVKTKSFTGNQRANARISVAALLRPMPEDDLDHSVSPEYPDFDGKLAGEIEIIDSPTGIPTSVIEDVPKDGHAFRRQDSGQRISWAIESKAGLEPKDRSQVRIPSSSTTTVKDAYASEDATSLNMNSDDDEESPPNFQQARIRLASESAVLPPPVVRRFEGGRLSQPPVMRVDSPLVDITSTRSNRMVPPLVTVNANQDFSVASRPPRQESPSNGMNIGVEPQRFESYDFAPKSIGESNPSTLQIFASPLSQSSQASGVILEGWLEKKSYLTGFWKKQYVILAESSSEFCVLKTFTKAVPSIWGMIPLQIRSVIPMLALCRIKAVTKKSAKGREFKVYVSVDKTGSYTSLAKLPTSMHAEDLALKSHEHDSDCESETMSENGEGNDKVIGKSLHFRAADPQIQLLWTTILRKACIATFEDFESASS